MIFYGKGLILILPGLMTATLFLSSSNFIFFIDSIKILVICEASKLVGTRINIIPYGVGFNLGIRIIKVSCYDNSSFFCSLGPKNPV